MSQLLVRDAIADDLPTITDIYNWYIDSGSCTMDDDHLSLQYWQKVLAELGPRQALLVIGPPGEVLGYGQVKRYSERGGYRYTCETSLYIRQDHVGRGLGSRLHVATIQRCKTLGYRHIVGKIVCKNEVSIAFNHRMGYERVGIQRSVGYKQGEWLDVEILQIVLDGSEA